MDSDEGPSTQPFSGTGLPDFDGSRWDDESCTGCFFFILMLSAACYCHDFEKGLHENAMRR
jgi:hypothetical protein